MVMVYSTPRSAVGVWDAQGARKPLVLRRCPGITIIVCGGCVEPSLFSMMFPLDEGWTGATEGHGNRRLLFRPNTNNSNNDLIMCPFNLDLNKFECKCY